jgi:hypothetical protein
MSDNSAAIAQLQRIYGNLDKDGIFDIHIQCQPFISSSSSP